MPDSMPCVSRSKSAKSRQRSTYVEEAKNCADRSVMARRLHETLSDGRRPLPNLGQVKAPNTGRTQERSGQSDFLSQSLGCGMDLEPQCIHPRESMPVACRPANPRGAGEGVPVLPQGGPGVSDREAREAHWRFDDIGTSTGWEAQEQADLTQLGTKSSESSAPWSIGKVICWGVIALLLAAVIGEFFPW